MKSFRGKQIVVLLCVFIPSMVQATDAMRDAIAAAIPTLPAHTGTPHP